MPTLPELLLQLIEASWRLARTVIPLLYLGFLAHAFTERAGESLAATVVRSQRSYTLQYGIYTVAGLLVGGVPALSLPGAAGTAAGGATAVAACIYGATQMERPEREQLDLENWDGWLKLPWLAVPVLAAVALATGDLLLKSLTALVFLSAVFWEV